MQYNSFISRNNKDDLIALQCFLKKCPILELNGGFFENYFD